MQKLGIALLLITFIQFKTAAQVTPQPSPGASFSQTVGITEIIVDYSRPGVKGRTIFGGLLPFGKVWRTGANAATQISFSSDVRINDMPLIAGTYSIVSFPGEETWIIVFSNDLEVTEADYDPRFDALRVFVKPQKANFTETFTINLSDVQENNGRLGKYNGHLALLFSGSQVVAHGQLVFAGHGLKLAQLRVQDLLDLGIAESGFRAHKVVLAVQ
ncbi:MAG: DUF2911 domain-containing protein, partial [Cytophagales bacterium]|nr:DUF2911 domain-containing protein [Cytophagales bacterium]